MVNLLRFFGGSSPRVRGTLNPGLYVVAYDGFIPARAGNAPRWPPWPIPMPVHPRACGERLGSGGYVRLSSGSSPRVRGTHRPPGFSRAPTRFIPARAGNATYRAAHFASIPVHPRACGERDVLPLDRRLVFGSSPRVRGTRPEPLPGADRVRFIPARAGNAGDRRRSSPRYSVHPRACGERCRQRSQPGHAHGSSPRVRGTPPLDMLDNRPPRFIPARAGNAVASGLNQVVPTVHPRACGERCRQRSQPGHPHGSSPRVRGTRLCLRRGHGADRFIPARAGNAGTSSPSTRLETVHPRACGERHDGPPPVLWRGGSSPRVRGTPAVHPPGCCPVRFIPARAGNAPLSRQTRPETTVHPRACGERYGGASLSRWPSGSSPRVRGTRVDLEDETGSRRFIPARAGNASCVQ